jgi:hypothetical protein
MLYSDLRPGYNDSVAFPHHLPGMDVADKQQGHREVPQNGIYLEL